MMVYRKLFISQVIFYLFLGTCFAQNFKIDSLHQLLQPNLKDTTRINILNELSWEYHRVDLEKCFHLATQALEKSLEIDYPKGEARALNLQAIYHSYQGKEDAAIVNNLRSLAIAKSINDWELIGSATNDLGISYDVLLDRAKALEYYQTALEMAEKIKDTLGISFTLGNMGMAHYAEGNTELSRTYLNRSIEIGRKAKDSMVLSSAYENLGYMELDEKNYDTAMIHFNKAKDIAIKSGDKMVEGEILLAEAEVYRDQKHFEIAQQQVNQALRIFDNLCTPVHILNSHYLLADIYLKQEKGMEALKPVQKGLELAAEMEMIEYQTHYLKQLSSVYEVLGNIENAYKYHKEYQKMSDSLYTVEKSKKVLELEKKYQLEKRIAENKLLKEEKAKNEAIIQRQVTMNFATFFILVLVLILLIMMFKNIKQNRSYRAALEKEVKERTQDLIDSNLKLTNSNEELERFAYIASHDLKEPLRNISGFTRLINRGIQKYDDPLLLEYLSFVETNAKQMFSLIEDVLEYSRVNESGQTKAVDLNQVMDEITLSMADKIKERNAILYVNDLPQLEANATQVFQLLKNLIENGIKYNENEVPTIKVKYQKELDHHKFVVSDNGIGIDPKFKDHVFLMFKRLHNRSDYEGSGLGLSIVKKIVENLGGTIELDSTPGEGSSFIFKIPLEDHKTQEERVLQEELS